MRARVPHDATPGQVSSQTAASATRARKTGAFYRGTLHGKPQLNGIFPARSCPGDGLAGPARTGQRRSWPENEEAT
jgi:hypothetical protein